MTREAMEARGWEELDVLLVTGDAYVDHPSFGAALLGRGLEAEGYRVGIVAQPPWDTVEALARMGRPRLFAGVTAGALDSMLAHYTAFRKRRHDDAYTPGGRAGARPNRASLVYANLVKRAFPGLPVVLGGIEASLRRFSHYDFWSDAVRRSLLLDAKADLLVYGMGERAVLDLARRIAALLSSTSEHALNRNFAPGDAAARHSGDAVALAEAWRGIPGTLFAAADESPVPREAEVLRHPSHEDILADPRRLLDSCALMERQVQDGRAWAVQRAGDRVLLAAPPAAPLSTEEIDALYALPFTRRAHPAYTEGVPAEAMIRFSATSHRGCAGGCSFCSLAAHQGRRIVSRSERSLRGEVEAMTAHPLWTGHVSDVGGPSANMWRARCAADPAKCRRPSCLHPDVCRQFETERKAPIRLLRMLSRIPGVKSVRIASGIRHDLAALNPEYTRVLIREYVGGQLKLAPEHLCDEVLRLMRKPAFRAFESFLSLVERESEAAGKRQFVVPYLMSAFPGCTDEHMRALANWLARRGWKPQQVQCFIPLPGTLASAMFLAGAGPDGRPIPVARTDAERLRQHRLLTGESTDRPTPKRPKRD